MKQLYIAIMAALMITGCTQEDMIGNALDGQWNILRYERTRINQDGSIDTLLSETDAGYWIFYSTEITSSSSKAYDFVYNGSQGSQSQSGYLQVGEGGTRLILLGGTCIGCDNAFTIEEFAANSMRLTSFSPQDNGTFTYKLAMDLAKQ